jgi:hypothetical protein
LPIEADHDKYSPKNRSFILFEERALDYVNENTIAESLKVELPELTGMENNDEKNNAEQA